jgi:hypothetical protein
MARALRAWPAEDIDSTQLVRNCVECGTPVNPRAFRCRVHAAANARRIRAESRRLEAQETGN